MWGTVNLRKIWRRNFCSFLFWEELGDDAKSRMSAGLEEAGPQERHRGRAGRLFLDLKINWNANRISTRETKDEKKQKCENPPGMKYMIMREGEKPEMLVGVDEFCFLLHSFSISMQKRRSASSRGNKCEFEKRRMNRFESEVGSSRIRSGVLCLFA